MQKLNLTKMRFGEACTYFSQRTLSLFLLLLMVVVGNVKGWAYDYTYVFNTSTDASHDVGTSIFQFGSKDITITNDGGKKIQNSTYGGLKFSKDVTYTVTLPIGERVKKVTFSGISNADDKDSYVRYINGKERTGSEAQSTQFPSRKTYTQFVEYVVPFNLTIKREFSFKLANAESVLNITIEADDATQYTVEFGAEKLYSWSGFPDGTVTAYNVTTEEEIESGSTVRQGEVVRFSALNFGLNAAHSEPNIPENQAVLSSWKITEDGVTRTPNPTDGIPTSGMAWYNTRTSYEMQITKPLKFEAVYGLGYKLHMESAEHGSMTATLGGSTLTGGSVFFGNSEITMTAIPDDGYTIDHWEAQLHGENDVVWPTDGSWANWGSDLTKTFTAAGSTFDYKDGVDIYVKPVFKTDVQIKHWNFLDKTAYPNSAADVAASEASTNTGLTITSNIRHTNNGMQFRDYTNPPNSVGIPVKSGQYVIVKAYIPGSTYSVQYNVGGDGHSWKNESGKVFIDCKRVTSDGMLNINATNYTNYLYIQSIDIYDTEDEIKGMLTYNLPSQTTTYRFDNFDTNPGLTNVYDGKFAPGDDNLRIRTDAGKKCLRSFANSSLIIKNVPVGDKITIVYGDQNGNGAQLSVISGSVSLSGNEVPAGTIIPNNTEFIAIKGGDITLKAPVGIAITSIKIVSTNKKIDFAAQQLYTANETEGFGPSKLLSNSTGITATYESSNTDVAKFDNGQFRLINIGQFNVIATVTYDNGYKLTAELPVDVYSKLASYEVVGNTFRFTDNGYLETRVIKEVPKIVMTLGNESEKGALVDKNGSVYQYKLVDANGYTHVFVPNSDNIPTMGTFYKFESKATGTLTLKVNNGDNSVVFVNATDKNIEKISLTVGNQTIAKTLDKDKTYYIYGSTKDTPEKNNDNYTTLMLQEFTFEATFKFEKKSYIYNSTYTYKGGEGDITANWTDYTSASKLINDATRVEVKCLGDVTAEADGLTGKVRNISGNGGAIVVTAYSNLNESDYYVITVPYTEKEWNFKNNLEYSVDENSPNLNSKGVHFTKDGDANSGIKVRDWAVTYEVRDYDSNSKLFYLNEAILSPNVSIAGNNAAYIGQTAGLIFEASPKQFGLRGTGTSLESLWRDYKIDHSEVAGLGGTDEMPTDVRDLLLRQMRDYDPEEIHKTSINCAAMEKGAVLRIPNLPAGTFVAIKFFRHAPGTGDAIKVTNVKDLSTWQSNYWTDHNANNIYQPTVSAKQRQASPDGASVLNVTVGNQTNSKDVYASKYGWLEFQVDQTGDVTIEVTDKGWTHIKKIAISPKFINTDLYLAVNNHTATTRYALSNEPGGDPENIIKYDNNIASVHGEQTKSVFYSLENVQTSGGTDKITITAAGQLKANYPGTADVVQKVFNNNDNDHPDALIDIQKTHIVIVAEGNTQQSYPYTWDFTKISNETKTKLANYKESGTDKVQWSGNETDGYKVNTDAQGDYLQNSELCYDLSDRYDDNDVKDKDSQRNSENEIKEFYGLGFQTSINPENGQTNGLSDMTIKPGTGLIVAANADFAPVVPDVPTDAMVYVRTTGGGSVTLVPFTEDNADLVEIGTTVIDPTDGSSDKIYSVPGKGGDVVVQVEGTTIKGIGVTNIYKQCIFWDDVNTTDGHYCYHSDSHDVNIDYTLTKFYTDIEMKAYKTATYTENGDDKYLAFAPIEVAPAGDGVIVRTIDYRVDHPLFVPAINTSLSNMSGNRMVGFPNGGSADYVKTQLNYDSNKTNCFGFTNLYGRVTNDELGAVNMTAAMPGFYRLYISGTTSLNKNLAILNMALSASSAKAIRFVFKDSLDDDETSIDGIAVGEEGEYYTLTGVKLQAKPTAKGVYILNGKKVLVK